MHPRSVRMTTTQRATVTVFFVCDPAPCAICHLSVRLHIPRLIAGLVSRDTG